MLKWLMLFILLIFTELSAKNIERELGINVGLNSTKNSGGSEFKNPTISVTYQDNKYVVIPRVDLEYVNINGDYADALLKGSINGIYEYENNQYYVVPYALAGLGYEYVSGGVQGVFESHPFIQGGIGARMDLKEGYKARVEGKMLKILGGDGEGNEAIVTAGVSFPFDYESYLNSINRKPKVVQRKPQPITRPKPRTKIVYVHKYIDKNECPIKISAPDLDRDGVTDSIDQCPATPCSFSVDSYGCPLKTTLQIHFASNSAAIRDYSFAKINNFANFLMRNRGSIVHIVGHTDSKGSASHNMTLSYRRANAVVQALIQRGVSPSRLYAVGKGESMPIASNQTVSGRAMNRRIEAELSYPKGRR